MDVTIIGRGAFHDRFVLSERLLVEHLGFVLRVALVHQVRGRWGAVAS